MEGTKINKGSQGNNRRFLKNRRDDNPCNHPIHPKNTPSFQGGKINSVKPQHSSADHTKHPEVKSEIVVQKQGDGNKQEGKGNLKRKDGNVHGERSGQYQHGHKANRSNVKNDDRRKFNFPKEKANTRQFRPTQRHHNKGNEVLLVNDETRTRTQENKNESAILKRNDNTNMSSTPQHLKPAVHVQPLQQLPETGTRHTVEKNSNTLQTNDVHVSNEASAERCQDVSNVSCPKESSTQRVMSHQTSSVVQAIPATVETRKTTERVKQDFQKPNVVLDQNPLNQMNPIFPAEARSLADLNTSGLGGYLSSSICSSFVSQKEFLKPQNNPLSNQDGCLSPAQLAMAQGHPKQNLVTLRDRNKDPLPRSIHDNVKQPPLDHPQNYFETPHEQLEEAVSYQNVPDEKYGYRISVDSLFSTSFFTNPDTDGNNKAEMMETIKNQQGNKDTTVVANQILATKTQHDLLLNKTQQYDVENDDGRIKINTKSPDSLMFRNEKCHETLVLPTQLPHDQLTNKAKNFDAENPSNMKNNTKLNNHVLKKCNETTVLSGQVQHNQLLNEAQQLDVVNPSNIKTNNCPSLLDYQSLSEPHDTYKNDKNFDTHLVSPRRLNDHHDKTILESPPPVLRNLAPHVSLESKCSTVFMKEPPFSLETANTRTYRSFTGQPENGIERLPPGKMSGFSRENSAKEPENNVAQLSCAQGLQEPMKKLSLTKTNSDVQTDSMVNLNYREIPKHSMALPTDGFPAGETKKAVSGRCPGTSDKTSQLTKVQSTNKEGYEKNDPPLLERDAEENHLHQGPFSHGPFLPNPFLSHSLLTHRQAIPSAFVYPSRVGIPGSHSSFTDVGPHTGTNPGSHIFPPHGTTVYLNVGGRIFEILPSTFAPYPESLLCQIFTGTAPAPISQRGHIFFDRDGYLFEIILAFARVGHFTLPPNVNLTSLMNEAKFFGMYEYMFQKGQVSFGNMLQFQRTTRCTLHCDDSAKTSDTRVFVLQGDDKLKIESLRVSGPCNLYVDLYTPSGVIETSNFVIYTPDKPDLWKAYQFCAERQLVFHLQQAHTDTTATSCNKSSVDIVFAQTFSFAGDEFIS